MKLKRLIVGVLLMSGWCRPGILYAPVDLPPVGQSFAPGASALAPVEGHYSPDTIPSGICHTSISIRNLTDKPKRLVLVESGIKLKRQLTLSANSIGYMRDIRCPAFLRIATQVDAGIIISRVAILRPNTYEVTYNNNTRANIVCAASD